MGTLEKEQKWGDPMVWPSGKPGDQFNSEWVESRTTDPTFISTQYWIKHNNYSGDTDECCLGYLLNDTGQSFTGTKLYYDPVVANKYELGARSCESKNKPPTGELCKKRMATLCTVNASNPNCKDWIKSIIKSDDSGLLDQAYALLDRECAKDPAYSKLCTQHQNVGCDADPKRCPIFYKQKLNKLSTNQFVLDDDKIRKFCYDTNQEKENFPCDRVIRSQCNGKYKEEKLCTCFHGPNTDVGRKNFENEDIRNYEQLHGSAACYLNECKTNGYKTREIKDSMVRTCPKCLNLNIQNAGIGEMTNNTQVNQCHINTDGSVDKTQTIVQKPPISSTPSQGQGNDSQTVISVVVVLFLLLLFGGAAIFLL